jgi:histidyl-tRNA synthetase
MVDSVKGFRDITGEEAEKRIAIRNIIENVFRIYGFEAVETPVIEYEDFVKGNNSSDEAVSDIFKLEDRGKRKLALRYEFTFQLKRLAMNKKLPFKRYQIGNVFRDEPTGENRFRQFTQCDCDVVGSSVRDEAEILKIAAEIFDKLGIKVSININNRKLLNEILEKQGVKSEFKQEVIKELDKIDKLSEKEIKENLKKFNAEKILDIFKKPANFFEKYDSYKEILELEKECSKNKVKINFVPFLARGLSYYNGSIFEIKTSDKNIRETISAGGSYLVNGIQSTGISFGLDRLAGIANIKEELKDKILIISLGQDKKAIELANKIRKENRICVVMYGKVTKALEYANSYGFNKVVFIGDEEVKKKKILMKDMKTGKEKLVNEKEVL